jgi:hypothetical protein
MIIGQAHHTLLSGGRMQTPHVMSGGRYPVLRSLAILYLVVAGLTALGSIVAAAWALFAAPWDMLNKVGLAAAILAGGFFLVVSMLAVAELIKLFIDLEHNTRLSVPGRIGAAESVVTPEVARTDGAVTAHVNRLTAIDEETAEGALLRGH